MQSAAQRCARFGLLSVGLLLSLTARAEVVASEGWAPATAQGERMGVAYLVLTNRGEAEQKLLRIASPVSDQVVLQWVSRDAGGALRAWPLSWLSLASGETLRLEPGGRQVVFRNLKVRLEAGTSIPLELHFDGGQAPIVIQLEVRPVVAAAGSVGR